MALKKVVGGTNLSYQLRTELWRMIDRLYSPFVLLIGLSLRPYFKGRAERMPRTLRKMRAHGWYPIVDHYYQPMFNTTHLHKPLDESRPLPGIEFRMNEQKALLEMLSCEDEVLNWPVLEEDATDDGFYIRNGNFEGADADFLYAFLRYLKPSKLVEIGSGHSTKVAVQALEMNSKEGVQCRHVCIEPFEAPFLSRMPVELIRERVQECSMEIFQSLDYGDVLFIDSSHMVRPQGDVLFELLEIIPILQPGVYVHIHDIFTPRDYPRDWIVNRASFWNEQYVLEALLTHSNHLEVVASLNILARSHQDALERICPHLCLTGEPGSFWFRTVIPPTQ